MEVEEDEKKETKGEGLRVGQRGQGGARGGERKVAGGGPLRTMKMERSLGE